MKLGYYFKRAVIYPSIVAVLCVAIYSGIDNADYKSEWLTAEAVVLMSLVTAILYCLIMVGLSATIFLNRIDKIRKNGLLNFLSWFLLPTAFMMICLLHEYYFYLEFNPAGLRDSLIPVIVTNVPFMVGLIWSYYKYRRAVRQNVASGIVQDHNL